MPLFERAASNPRTVLGPHALADLTPPSVCVVRAALQGGGGGMGSTRRRPVCRTGRGTLKAASTSIQRAIATALSFREGDQQASPMSHFTRQRRSGGAPAHRWINAQPTLTVIQGVTVARPCSIRPALRDECIALRRTHRATVRGRSQFHPSPPTKTRSWEELLMLRPSTDRTTM